MKIQLHKDDIATLNYIKNRLNIGYVTEHGNVSVLIIQKVCEVKIIINMFSNNPLNTKKRLDFEDWKLAFEYYMEVKDDKSRIEPGAKIKQLKDLGLIFFYYFLLLKKCIFLIIKNNKKKSARRLRVGGSLRELIKVEIFRDRNQRLAIFKLLIIDY